MIFFRFENIKVNSLLNQQSKRLSEDLQKAIQQQKFTN